MRAAGQSEADGARASVGAGHVPALDGVRGLAVLLVVLFHTTHLSSASPEGRAVWWLAGAGWSGVDLFFVLSGFLITGILTDARGQPGYYVNFYARRVLRIFPLYYATLALCFLVLPPLAARLHLDARITTDGAAWYLLYLSNFYQLWVDTTHPVLGVVWSLAIEEQFYVVWPWLIAALSPRGAVRLCLGVIAFALGARLGLASLGLHGEATYVTTLCRADSLAAGGLLALLLRLEPAARVGRWLRLALCAAAPVVLLMMVLPVSPGERLLHETVGYTAVGALYTGLVYAAVTARPGAWVGRLLTTGALRTLGKYSYAVYLVHSPLDAVLRRTLFPGPLPQLGGSDLPAQLLFYALSLGGSLALALVSWNLFEKHFLKLKRHFPSAGPVPAAAAVAVRPG